MLQLLFIPRMIDLLYARLQKEIKMCYVLEDLGDDDTGKNLKVPSLAPRSSSSSSNQERYASRISYGTQRNESTVCTISEFESN